MFGGTVVIDGVAPLGSPEMTQFKADEDLVFPGPDAMIRRPARETPLLMEDHNMPDIGRGGGEDTGRGNRENQSSYCPFLPPDAHISDCAAPQ